MLDDLYQLERANPSRLLPVMPGYHAAAARDATRLYEAARRRATWRRLWNWLIRRPSCLLCLRAAGTSRAMYNAHCAGIRTVPIDHIRGSESRSHDFDADFFPANDHTMRRWIGIASARRLGEPLPPVVLIRMGDVYYVRDGHHRISVARAMGQECVEAEVTVWQRSGLFSVTESVAGELSGELAGEVRQARRAPPETVAAR